MNQKFSNSQLRDQMKILVREEREAMAKVLEKISQIDQRRTYIEWGFTSLFQYLTSELKYSEGAANRRQNSARALRKNPNLVNEVREGTLNLTQISMVQTTLRQQEKLSGEKVTMESREKIFEAIRSKNKVETQKVLSAECPDILQTVPVIESHRHDDSVQVTLNIPKELYQKLQKLKLLYSHIAPGADLVKVLDLMATDAIQKRDPSKPLKPKIDRHALLAGKSARVRQASNPTKTISATTVPNPIRRFVFQRDEGKCQHKTPAGVCGSQFQLEVDHIQPKFTGGSNETSNLRLLCRVHNQARYLNGT